MAHEGCVDGGEQGVDVRHEGPLRVAQVVEELHAGEDLTHYLLLRAEVQGELEHHSFARNLIMGDIWNDFSSTEEHSTKKYLMHFFELESQQSLQEEWICILPYEPCHEQFVCVVQRPRLANSHGIWELVEHLTD